MQVPCSDGASGLNLTFESLLGKAPGKYRIQGDHWQAYDSSGTFELFIRSLACPQSGLE